MTIHQKIQAFYGEVAKDPHHRYRSWEHCYQHFRRNRKDGSAADPEQAALHLAFYLASWGTYRGSSFLLQHSYRVHRKVVKLVVQRRFTALWKAEFGAKETDSQFVPVILELVGGVKDAYSTFAENTEAKGATDTLITKVLLGTFGCLPACDQYFIAGFRSQQMPYSKLNGRFIERVHEYCQDNLADLLKARPSEKRRYSCMSSTGNLVYFLVM